MSAQLLREAAALMRSRAGAATPGLWRNMRGAEKGESVVANATVIAQMHGRDLRENRRHIASWHPAVSLAVADLLENVSCNCPPCSCCGIVISCLGCEPIESAVNLANAYLGRTS